MLSLFALGSVRASEVVYSKSVVCSSEVATFRIIKKNDLPNGASAKIVDIVESVPFGGEWLWTLETHEGQLNEQIKYKTTEGGVLTLASTVQINDDVYCGRALCNFRIKEISGHYISSKGEESIYSCHEKIY